MTDTSEKPPYKLRRPGGEIDQSRIFNVPGILLGLAGATVFFFIALRLAPDRAAYIFEYSAAVSPERFMRGPEGNGGLLAMLSPLIAHMFVHASVSHLFMNTAFMLAFGAPVARRMGTDNALKSTSAFASASLFLTFYFLSGIFGSLFYIALHANQPIYLVGASGGVSGLLGGLVRFAFNRSTLFGPEHATISPLTSPSVISWSIVVIAMNIFIGVFGGGLVGGASIAWEAHIGGYLFGLITYPFFEHLAKSFGK